MNFDIDESDAILSKSLSLIEKTIVRLRRVDQWEFPTGQASETARQLLVDALLQLREPANLTAIDSAVLYNRLFSLQELAAVVERSSTARISWPLVSYCDLFWKQLFPTSSPKIFYALTPEHTYSILRFSTKLAKDLNGLLPQNKIDDLVRGRELYCLQLASSEDDNLPLYANIGHEFGHAVYDHHDADIWSSLVANISNVYAQIRGNLIAADPAEAGRRLDIVARVLLKIATELFCDLIGARLMGPAFYLSLYEFSWGQSKTHWIVSLKPNDQVVAYPSFHFRLHSIKKWAMVDDFCDEAKKAFVKIKTEEVRDLAGCLSTVPDKHDDDVVVVGPLGNIDATAIQAALTAHLTDLKQAFEQFLESCNTQVEGWYNIAAPIPNAGSLAELLMRLEQNILPNIVPDGTLLGTRAEFTEILNASALYRTYLLTCTDVNNLDEFSRSIGIVERLTAKAFEATLMQMKYKQWQEARIVNS
jgi:hypothetical protein